jgi:hypothetical protein
LSQPLALSDLAVPAVAGLAGGLLVAIVNNVSQSRRDLFAATQRLSEERRERLRALITPLVKTAMHLRRLLDEAEVEQMRSLLGSADAGELSVRAQLALEVGGDLLGHRYKWAMDAVGDAAEDLTIMESEGGTGAAEVTASIRRAEDHLDEFLTAAQDLMRELDSPVSVPRIWTPLWRLLTRRYRLTFRKSHDLSRPGLVVNAKKPEES